MQTIYLLSSKRFYASTLAPNVNSIPSVSHCSRYSVILSYCFTQACQ